MQSKAIIRDRLGACKGQHGGMFKGSKSEGYWDGRSCGWVLVRGPEVGDCLALEDTWKGSGYGVSCWMRRDVPRFGSEIGQAQSKMG